jgi:hypothetical protein
MGTGKSLIGSAFGRLIVLLDTGLRKNRSIIWECSCACGNTHTVSTASLVSGKSKSCGCLKRELAKAALLKHGYTSYRGKKPKLYSIWCGIRARCNRETHKHYASYGGRGIKVCPTWGDYATFERDILSLGDKPEDSYSLDRVNNDGDYEPGNIRWATKTEQSRNRRNIKRITFNGKTQTAEEWGLELGIPPTTIRQRYNKGYSVEDCLAITSFIGKRYGTLKP